MAARWMVLLALTLLTGCTSSGDLPDGATVLSKSSDAMRSVTSTHFTIKVEGDLPDVNVKDAVGDLTNTGDSKGNAKVSLGGNLVQIEYVLVEKNLYFKGPTGGFTKLPAAFAGQVYDPTAILNPDKGVANVLKSSKDAKTESAGDQTVVNAVVPKDVIAKLVPGISGDVKAKYTVDKENRLVQGLFELTGGQKVQIGLSDFNKSLTITAPTT
ncbi:lipoarabinomannan carrier protein LprG [Lentzea sp. NBRC 105346]|uniref:LppX_LprAFG lipoprotein n=1 Tax=Lentzea sp. NBRC 105346 TaxID=3032205 RepID=UPI0024A2F698|nr:LppX_LprAFG lipoprotein [Lentzea sp. NBRC 105346]GLZ36319.1 lipoarabinomannan carrier protein LprG [Lentzea sp. NBRC 105346]